jgi:hypothetical protein
MNTFNHLASFAGQSFPLYTYAAGRLTGVVADDLNARFWGLGVSSSANNLVFEYDIKPGFPTWTQVDTQDNYTASKIVLFTGNIFGQSYQTPVIYNGGQIAFYNSSTGRFVPQQTLPLFDVTDHFVVALQNNRTEIYQYGDLTGWSDYGSGLTPNGTWIIHIAASNQNPSQLWGLDTNGHIFYGNTITPK